MNVQLNAMKRREFLKCAAGTGAGALLAEPLPAPVHAEPARSKRPNVILIMTDDQGYGELGCHGNELIKTPHIDSFFEESIRFKRFFVSPTCSPTRAGLLTGRHEFRCGISHTILGRSIIHEDEITIADILSGAGYKTGIFGKWHLGDNYPSRPMDKGFQECLYHGGGGITQTPDYWGNSYFSPVLRHNDDWVKSDGYCTDVFFDGALDWIGENRENPFFAYITPNAPHGPLQVDEKYSRPYEEMGLSPTVAKFYGMITNIDDNVGKLVRRIKEMDLEKNTLIIFMTDNGSAQACGNGTFNDSMRGCKGSQHEGGVRVPCFFRWPGTLDSGKDIEYISAHNDILPTLAELCGAELPNGRKLDGISLVPLLHGDSDDWRDRYIFTHVGRWPAGVDPIKYERCSVRSQKYRMVNCKELYDMDSDPGETNDISIQNSEILSKMNDAYEIWWDEVIPRVLSPQKIIVGAKEEQTSVLACHDWKSSIVEPGKLDFGIIPLWRQDCLKALALGEPFKAGGKQIPEGAMGSWAVKIARTGRYSLTLSKLPSSAEKSWLALKEGDAHMQCGNVRKSVKIARGDASVTIEAKLPQGDAEMECWLTGQRNDGKLTGAYFVEIEYLG
jgi:arylsulfatase A-like enzyme